MARQVSYPGIYFEEFTPGAPIQGAVTNVAAFLGPAVGGDPNVPTKIASFDEFKQIYGSEPLNGFYLWYAVRGFYENGGNVCYIVRVSNGTYSGLGFEDPPAPSSALTDDSAAGNPLIRVRARTLGALTPPIKVTVTQKHLLPAASLYQVAATTKYVSVSTSGLEVTVTAGHGVQFRPGDSVTISNSAGTVTDLRTVVRVDGDTLRLDQRLANTYTGANNTVKLSNPSASGTRTVRLVVTGALPPKVLVPGAMLTVAPGANQDAQIVQSVSVERFTFSANPVTTYRVIFRQPLAKSFDISSATVSVRSEEFDLKVARGAGGTTYASLALDSEHPNYFLDIVNGDDQRQVDLSLADPPPPSNPPENMPANQSNVGLKAGTDEDLPSIGPTEYRAALDSLKTIPDVSLVAIPDAAAAKKATDRDAIQHALLDHCEGLGDRFAVIDSAAGLAPLGDSGVEGQINGLSSAGGYAALYYPWILVQPSGSGDPIPVPPSGHVCGVIARTDDDRGVFKAPAGIASTVNGASAVVTDMSNEEQGILNLDGVNVIRVFRSGGRPTVWGARTTATQVDSSWQYVNIRRLFLFLERSILVGIRWAIFEPNNPRLWEKLRRTLTDFLTRVWRDGGLFGNKAEEAFYVRIDEALNPDSDRALGRLTIEIGVRPSYPAEFIIVRIGIWDGGSQVSEQ